VQQQCAHCHLEASPQRDEIMGWDVMELILEAVKSAQCQLVDLTGGAPELNPIFAVLWRLFVGAAIRSRSNEPDRFLRTRDGGVT